MDEEKVLDLPKQKRPRNKFIWFFIASIALMLTGYLFVIQHWPFGNLMIVVSTVLFSIYLVLSFIENGNRAFFQYCYLIGKVAVIFGLNLWFLEFDQIALYFVYSAFAVFIAGVVSLFIKS
jgi:hypothetical protein